MTDVESQLARICSQIPSTANVRIVVELASTPDETRVHELKVERSASISEKAECEPMDEGEVISWLHAELASKSAPDFSSDLLDSAQVARRMRRAGLTPLRGKRVNAMLKGAGYTPLGTIRGAEGPANYWSIRPELFCDEDGIPITRRVRDHFKPL